MALYKLTARANIAGKGVLPAGTIVELSDKVAKGKRGDKKYTFLEPVAPAAAPVHAPKADNKK